MHHSAIDAQHLDLDFDVAVRASAQRVATIDRVRVCLAHETGQMAKLQAAVEARNAAQYNLMEAMCRPAMTPYQARRLEEFDAQIADAMDRKRQGLVAPTTVSP